jgi:hypothetical protein
LGLRMWEFSEFAKLRGGRQQPRVPAGRKISR